MTNKTARNFLKVFTAFAIAASFVSASFAGEFTVEQGKRYRATLALKPADVFQVQERHAGLRVFGQARIRAQPCRLRSLQSLH
jgi:hypothetical protein